MELKAPLSISNGNSADQFKYSLEPYEVEGTFHPITTPVY